MRYTYLIINFLIILVPLLYSADRRIRYYRCFPALACSIVIVGLPYIVWDAVVTRWREWSFNPPYIIGVYVMNLPIEEILFFVTVPFSCLFIYESVAYYTEDRPLRFSPAWFVALALALGAAALIAGGHGYTMKAFLACALALVAGLALRPESLLGSRHWLWLAICYIPFFVVNSLLTAIPVVEYNPAAILGPRIGTIPVEDFFYNFSMLSLYGLFYLVFKDRLRIDQGDRARAARHRAGAVFARASRHRVAERWRGR